jgi:hypothetical protein
MAHHGHHDEIVPPKNYELPGTFKMVCGVLVLIGLAAFGGGFTYDPNVAWKGFIIGMWFTLGLSLFGPFLASTQRLAAVGWSVSLHRLLEAFGAFIPVAIGAALIGSLVIPDSIFLWQQPDAGNDPILAKKLGFLDKNWFILTNALALVAMSGISFAIRRVSHRQDEESGYDTMYRQQQLSAAYLVCFAFTVSFMSWYWLMSLEPNWFSTMFSVYAFAGMFQSGLALTYILIIVLGTRGVFGSFMGMRQVHDVGKLVFGFTTFYAYIGFCQFLLIWYANIPEEATWYLQRIDKEPWAYFTLALPFLKFVIPFLIMLPQNIKKNKNNIMFFLCMWLIFMQVYEIWYWVEPEPHGISTGGHGGGHHGHALTGTTLIVHTLIELGVTLGFFGAFGLVAGTVFSRHNTIPVKDPLLHETLPHHTHEPTLMDIEEF